ncbi:acylphosphatase [Vibrio sp. UCD-FRSSP16_10]|uniref:acylphosphatase n=1 Tax=unclassified Vibrio TaxID=2614977 RepID=UPI0007FF2CCA|nr:MULTISPECIES: acylphosphatase [unclassified Vibrio]OBT13508.1 acylphosphatase [Vibrio sp. UCD-FRSSP16_30]OBT19967.1 acylphosphatase [Vibrio sp. UCD-FRSSP16_10]
MQSMCQKFHVTGIVQMVGFRYHTAHVGTQLGLTGYAKNLNDGSVEVVACGNELAIEKLAAWLEVGPRTASVDSLTSLKTEFRHYADFSIL